ncbi:hypothetical protein COU54_02145 [Candidatus Pacearchaeota archaeon CG10_big_fil_rev_8_21_14_0_10_31_24]|nr:MAG: hypothetical protein COU54_02145 [Candidatus Pacearchaeota archaeon CG10_big_fil_rev_8_21_14_0_10_31_24]
MDSLETNYKKYKWFYTSSDKLVIGGKNAIQNDELLKIVSKSNKEYTLMHTSEPGSPFTLIFSNSKPSKEDIEETAIFTACFSQAWKTGKKLAQIDVFSSKTIFKSKSMKTGTWGVKLPVKKIKVPLKLVLTSQKGIIRAVPEKSTSKPLLILTPGKIKKEDLLSKIEIDLDKNISQEELLSALPSGGIKTTKCH